METLLHNLSEVFAVSIIHSLWQCLIIYLLLRIFLADIVRLSAAVKYKITVTALFAATGWFIYTLFDEAANYSWHISIQATTDTPQHLPLITSLKAIAHADDRYEITIERYLPYVTTIYIAGLVFHTLRLLSAWFQMQQLKQNAVPDNQLQKRLNELSAMLNNKRAVIVSYADRIDVPCVTGYLKPLILLPLTLSTYLSAKEVEAILLHELAHVKRNDYLINLLQQVMSVILFFNPFVLLMNRIINQERENSCDDVVVALTGQPLVYAQALLKIEQNNVRYLPLALAATGKKYHLLNRIERIMKNKKPMANIRHIVLAFTILIGSITSIAWLNPAIGNGKLSVKTTKFSGIINSLSLLTDTTKKSAAAPKAGVTNAKKTHTAPKTNSNYKMWVDENGKKHLEKFDYNWGLDDPELERLSAEVTKYSDAITKYYDSAAFKQTSEAMEKIGREMNDFYNDAAIKKLQEDQQQVGRNYEAKWGETSEVKELSKQMEETGKRMNAYYTSAEFKSLVARLEKKYGIPHDYVSPQNDSEIRNPNYKMFRDELNKNIPADITASSEKMKQLGKQMSDHYNSPEMRAQSERMRAMGDSLRKAYSNPKIKEQQEEMKKLGEQMRAFQNNPDIKREQKLLNEASAKLRAYTNSPEFKKRTEEWKKNMKAMNWDFKFDMDQQINVEVPPIPPIPPINVAPSINIVPAPAAIAVPVVVPPVPAKP